jgi:hypothetical protein
LAQNLSDYKFSDTPALSGGGSSALLMKKGDKVIAVGFQKMRRRGSKNAAGPLLAKPADLKKIEFPASKTDIGLFYDVTTLTKGFHHFNVWFYVGNKSQEDLLGEYAKNGIEFTTKNL